MVERTPRAFEGATQRAWWWLTRTTIGRLLLLSLAIKAVVWIARAAGTTSPLVSTVNAVGSALLLISLVVLGYRAYAHGKRVVLWRVRRKLMLSYVFVGLVPVLLLVLFFWIAGLILFVNVGGYMLNVRVASLVDRVQALAQTAASDLAHVSGRDATAAALAAHQQGANAEFPLVSYVVVPSSAACMPGSSVPPSGPIATAGSWGHTAAPRVVPEWVSCAGYGSLVADREAGAAQPWVAARAVAWVTHDGVREAVIVDVPLGDMMLNQIAADTGVAVQSVQLYDESTAASDRGTSSANSRPAPKVNVGLGPANISLGTGGLLSGGVNWASMASFTAWDTGKPDRLLVQFGMGVQSVYEHLSASGGRINEVSIAQLLLVVLAVVAVLFLIILAVAFLVGFVLARSITGAVHELFEGTEKVRGGDFSHKIVVHSRDQLGELAESFNSMTASIEDLLQSKAQKERLEQELRIARGIQMSLLPQEPLLASGLHFAGHCEPAREVGGDYYDFWAIDDHRFGMLIADVAGKGTSAALYMAELKGIVLSFSQSHSSPRQLLIDANRIISNHLDTRRFITMTYGVVDVRARTLTYARAGHCPLIRLPGPNSPSQGAEVL
ncbi:MAG TPA: SpoIIE family protein phosphatase, partial [Vicinamibacterales bacterium]|nr:SpoIIE family protein phosphatase [Vicinamibacterales bacterium]